MKLILSSIFSIIIFSGCFNSKDKEVKFYGNVDIRTVSLAFRVSGRIQNMNFDEGEKIRAGQTIAKLDDSLYKEYLNQINAQILMQEVNINKLENGYRKEEISKAKAKLLQANIEKNRLYKEFKRAEKLKKEKSISTQEYDNIRAAYETSRANYNYTKSSLDLLENGYDKEDILSAKANLEALKAQRELHKINLEDTTLYSPTDGTVITRVYEVGSIVNSSQPVIEIAKDDEYWVRSYMNERYLGIIKPGLKATIHTDTGKEYFGEVSFISPIAEFTPKTVQTEELRTDLVYRFRIIIKDFDNNIRQGMPVTITFDDVDFDY